jgi:hypothetical protein
VRETWKRGNTKIEDQCLMGVQSWEVVPDGAIKERRERKKIYIYIEREDCVKKRTRDRER